MEGMDKIEVKLDFRCAHEVMPEASPELDEIFNYARWMQKGNMLKQDSGVDTEIERLYRIAAESGHYKAIINLQGGARRGQFKLRGAEHLRFSQELIDADIATGYYFVGTFLQRGAAGLKKDPETALRYIRMAADKGNAQAQYHVGRHLKPIDIAPAIAIQMYRCAAEQGHGEAALDLGIHLKSKERYQEALEAFQLGIAAGDDTSSSYLQAGFRGPQPDDTFYFLGQQQDLERAERYRAIWKMLSGWSYADPKVPEINDIVPLPPAKLPPWDGKLQWVEERLANIPPPKPSDELLRKLTDAKKLEFDTGKPMPGHPAFTRIQFPNQFCHSGQPCPETGYWRTHVYYKILDGEAQGTEFIQRFEAGEIMPKKTVEYLHYRSWPRRDKVEIKEDLQRDRQGDFFPPVDALAVGYQRPRGNQYRLCGDARAIGRHPSAGLSVA
jgi:hypothetical protein